MQHNLKASEQRTLQADVKVGRKKRSSQLCWSGQGCPQGVIKKKVKMAAMVVWPNFHLFSLIKKVELQLNHSDCCLDFLDHSEKCIDMVEC